MSADNSGGVFSSTDFTLSTINDTGSINASLNSSVEITISSGKPVIKFLPFIVVVKSLDPLNTDPIVTFKSSAVFSPIRILYLFLTYLVIASSNLSPATLIDSLITTPPNEITAISVVPPPISTIIWPSGLVISNPAPIAAANGSSIRCTLLAPEFIVASTTALFSTSVAWDGMHTITLGAITRPFPHAFFIKALSIFSVIS